MIMYENGTNKLSRWLVAALLLANLMIPNTTDARYGLVEVEIMKNDGGSTILNLQGQMTPPDKSTSDPIQAAIDGNALQIDFNADLGSVSIVVSGASGTLYNNTLPAYKGGNVQISLAGAAAGSYTLMVSSSYGNLSGGFSI